MTPSIAIFNPLSILGGSEISLLELLKRCKQDFDFHLILPEDGPLKTKADEIGINVWIVKWPEKLLRLGERNKKISILNLFGAVSSILRLASEVSLLLRDIDCKVLITNGIKCHIVGAMVRKKLSGSLIWYLREGLEGRRLTSFTLKLLAGRCDTAIVISNFVASEFHRLIPSGVPVHVLYNIVDLKKFKPGLSFPRDLMKTEKEIWFGTIGAITPLKGQDLFLKAAQKVLKVMPNSRFIIVGSNCYKTEAALHFEENLRAEAQSPIIGKHIKFLGFREDIPEILSAIDVLVQANRGAEGLGRSILEAMACGVPVVTVDRWGPAELVQHNSAGLLFKPMDIDKLSDRMIQLGKDAELRKKLGLNAHKWIQNEIDADKISEDFIRILKNTLHQN